MGFWYWIGFLPAAIIIGVLTTLAGLPPWHAAWLGAIAAIPYVIAQLRNAS